MAINKLCVVLLIAVSQLLTPVCAKTSDLPVFNIWGSQWGPLAGHARPERLPCLRVDQRACARAFSSSVTGAHHARTAGAVDPFKRASHTVSTSKRRVVYKNSVRISALGRRAGYAQAKAGTFKRVLPNMLLNDNDGRLLDANLDQPEVVQAVSVGSLADYVTTHGSNQQTNSVLLNDATGGLGNNAYVALYDFDDGATVSGNETAAGFQEITSLLDASSTRAAASVPEPSTCLLLGAGLLVLRSRGRAAQRLQGRLPYAQA